MGSFWLEYDQQGDVQRFSFDQDNITIGRDRSSDFVLDHPTISRQHALIVDDGGGQFRLVVLSQGGLTALDGRKIADEATLYDGSEIYLGKLVFRFRAEEAPERGQPGGGTGRSASSASGSNEVAARSVDQSSGGAASASQSSESVDSSSPAGIKSWDEIAQSAEVDEEEESGDVDASSSLADNIGAAGGNDDRESEVEETDPKVAIGGLIGIALFMAYFFWPAADGRPADRADPLDKKDPTKLVTVDCLSPEECAKKAKSAYQLGVDNLEKQGSEIGNLFKGYRRLLEAKQYLKKDERKSKPPELSDLQERIDKARKKLDVKFRNYQVKYRSAQKNSQPREMAEALKTIQRYFPDENAPEYDWAQKRILEMKKRGDYPAGY